MTKSKEPKVTLEPELQEQWRRIAGVNQRRFPRIGHKEVLDLVDSAWPPTVCMHEQEETTEIVIRFRGSSKQLSNEHQKTYFERSLPLQGVFEDAISDARVTGEDTIRWKLMTEAYRAYQMTWLHLLRSLWRNRTNSETDPPEWFTKVEKAFNTPKQKGRPKKIETQLRTRLDVLLSHTKRLRQTIEDFLADKPVKNISYRRDVVLTFWREIQKIPGGNLILGGEAFMPIPYGKQDRTASLADPKTWKARQLAIALLAIETGQKYLTIARKFPERKRNKVPIQP
jgi:hypothetical protein